MSYWWLVVRLKFYMAANKHLLPKDTCTDYLVLKDIIKQWNEKANK